jgi:hypothetical protein
MQYALNRADYEALMILGEDAADAPEEVRREIVAGEYPKNTAMAAAELVARGLKADAPALDYLIKKGAIHGPEGEGRNRKWTPANIDEAARYLYEIESFTPSTTARMVYNIDAAQDVCAQQEAFAKAPDVPPDPSYFVMTVKPGAPGADLPATVSYRRMTNKEEAEWQARVAEAKKARGRAGRG